MRALLTLLLGSLALGGCGSSAPACPASFTPCGGDITGTWTLRTGCGQSALVMSSCPGATSQFSSDVSGTATFNPNGTYLLSLTSDVSGMETFPASCLLGTQSCAMLAPSSTMPGSSGDVTCTGNVGQSCTCTGEVKSTLTDTGTYGRFGSFVALNGSSGPTGSQGYCVKSNQLELSLAGNTTYLIFTK
jgi:hypothetical protein